MTKARPSHKFIDTNIRELRGQVLGWYDAHKRDLPWRDGHDPYKTWLSEIMLQQTTVTAVKPYFARFLALWPSVQALAAAPLEDVLHEWAGLGYYARARNLHSCAQVVVSDHDGTFPQDQASLKSLPGIGDYTSAAITAIAFDKPAVVVDGNVERIMARLFAVKAALPKAKPILREKAALLMEGYADRPGDFAQALMDIGSNICRPKNPDCEACPLQDNCAASAQGEPAAYPKRAAKKARPHKQGFVYWVKDGAGRVLTHRRPARGLLGGMLGLPTSDWAVKPSDHLDFLSSVQPTNHTVQHVFSHFDLTLNICYAKLKGDLPGGYQFSDAQALEGLPTLFAKARDVMQQCHE